MNRDFWAAAGAIFGAAISAPLIIAAVRAFFFFGQMSRTVSVVEVNMGLMTKKVDTFIDEMHDYMAQTNERLTTIEVERRTERRDRRASDHDTDEHEIRP